MDQIDQVNVNNFKPAPNGDLVRKLVVGVPLLALILVAPVSLLALGQKVSYQGKASFTTTCTTDSPCIGVLKMVSDPNNVNKSTYMISVPDGSGSYILQAHPSVSSMTGIDGLVNKTLINRSVSVVGQVTNQGKQVNQNILGTIYIQKFVVASGGSRLPAPTGLNRNPTVPLNDGGL